MMPSMPDYTVDHFDPTTLRETACRVAEYVPRILVEYNADAVVVTGKSGISVAFAAMMIVDLPLVVVRKPSEKSHGYNIEGLTGFNRYIILDDFVVTGETIERTIGIVQKEADLRHVAGPTCVLVVQYAGNSRRLASVSETCPVPGISLPQWAAYRKGLKRARKGV